MLPHSINLDGILRICANMGDDDDVCIAIRCVSGSHAFARTRRSMMTKLHGQPFSGRSYLRQLAVKSVRVFQQLSPSHPRARNCPSCVISRQNASRFDRNSCGRKRALVLAMSILLKNGISIIRLSIASLYSVLEARLLFPTDICSLF